MKKFDPSQRTPMTNWYSPTELAQTAFRVKVAEVFGNYADKRETFTVDDENKYFDYRLHPDFWIDYVSDVGDGFDSTYSVAYLLAQEKISEVHSSDSKIQQTKRGQVLIMGGDEVYPTPSKETYDEKLKAVYEWASYANDNAIPNNAPEDRPLPHVFALPGNHDWYDGLSSFMKVFCQGRWLGQWKTMQTRSYFALRLPHGWWLWGIDIQLEGDLDKLQRDYFRAVARAMPNGDKLILCTPEPDWVHANSENKAKHERIGAFINNHIRNFVFRDEQGVEHTKSFDLRVTLSGDLHHYSRYENPKTLSQRITSGGGGSFLHPTHNLPKNLMAIYDYTPDGTATPNDIWIARKAIFPNEKESRGLLWRNLFMGIFNPNFGLALGIFCLTLFFFVQQYSLVYSTQSGAGLPSIVSSYSIETREELSCMGDALVLWTEIYRNPFALVVMLSFVFFISEFPVIVDPGFPKMKRWIGWLHAIVQIGVLTLVFPVFTNWSENFVRMTGAGGLAFWICQSLCFLSYGFLISSAIFGIYLTLSNLLLCVHDNEAFSTFYHEHYKNFLRLHITEEALTIYPMGIRQVNKNWRVRKEEDKYTTSHVVPINARDLKIELIEEPIIVRAKEKITT